MARPFSLVLALALSTIAPRAAQATIYCVLPAQKDGFAALRAAPGRDAPIVARMQKGDEVLLGIEERGRWIKVTWWKGGRFARGLNAEGENPPSGRGWMHQSLLSDDSCG
jgi:hypothetical protein